MILWWGYLSTSGHVQVKRFFDDRDMEDAYESPFVQTVVQPFSAKNQWDAYEKALTDVKERGYTN